MVEVEGGGPSERRKELLKWELGRVSETVTLLRSCIPDLHEAFSLGPVQLPAQGSRRSQLSMGNRLVRNIVWYCMNYKNGCHVH